LKNTIKSRSDFNFDNSISIAEPAFIMKLRPKTHENGRFGIIASKKIFPKAVQRNRAKRLIRAWMNIVKLPVTHDFLFIARSNILETGAPEGVKQLKNALGSI
jgi:ribonuclease P protein component